MAAKKPITYRMSNEHRDKIKNSNILNALIEHAEGVREMSGSQVTAGLGLLKKILPDLTNTQVTGADGGAIQHEHRHATDYTDEELAAHIAAGGD